MIVVYADESGTHDPDGIQPHSQYPIIAGFAARKSVWDKFCIAWNAILKKFDVGYFHGREITAARVAAIMNKASTNELNKNPYFAKGWDVKRIDSFKESLTKLIACNGIIPIAGTMSIPLFNQDIDNQEDKDPYRFCMRQFFAVYYTETQLQWGNFKSEVSFVFDQNDNKEWRNSVLETFDAFQKIDKRISGPNFADKKKFQHFPLQAADLFAYRARQHMEAHSKGELKITKLDKILLRNLLKSAAIKYPEIAHLLK